MSIGKDNEVIGVKPEKELIAIASDVGKILVFPTEQISVLSGPAQGVRIIKLKPGERVVSFETVDPGESLKVRPKRAKEKILRVKNITPANRATQGKKLWAGITSMEIDDRGEDQGQ